MAKGPEVIPPREKRRDERSASRGDECNDSDQDEIIHFDWKPGMILNDRYELTKLMGDGTFGRVVLARDRRENKDVAIKIIRDAKQYMEDAQIEAAILKDVRRADPAGTSGCCIMYDTFVHAAKFYCMTFEPLGKSLYEFQKENGFRGFWMQDLQAYARQSLEALRFLHCKLQLTHTDLKPENILLHSMEAPLLSTFPRTEWSKAHCSGAHISYSKPYRRAASARIKLIDFGNATYASEVHASIISTRQYRGPEVLLCLGWNELSDLWSIGCILMELYTGEQLFATHEELEHLALMEQILGSFPERFLDRALDRARSAGHGVDPRLLRKGPTGSQLNWPEGASSDSSKQHVALQKPLAEQVMPQHAAFASWLGALLTVDAGQRPSANDALQHQFFGQCYAD